MKLEEKLNKGWKKYLKEDSSQQLAERVAGGTGLSSEQKNKRAEQKVIALIDRLRDALHDPDFITQANRSPLADNYVELVRDLIDPKKAGVNMGYLIKLVTK